MLATELAAHGLKDFGIHGAVILKSDNEEAINALRHRVQAMHPGLTLGQMPAARAHDSNGVIENANKRGQVDLLRVLLLACCWHWRPAPAGESHAIIMSLHGLPSTQGTS